jgi:cytochrome c oxidase cbb3-type subunit 3
MKRFFVLLTGAIGLFGQEQGQSQFVQSCGFCHGRTAMGGSGGPNLMRSALVRHDEKGELIAPVIRDGRPDKGMPPIPLNQSQMDGIVTFLHARLAAGDRTSAGRPKHDYDAKLLLTGDAKQGEAFFRGAGGCGRCHSPAGDLAGIAKKYPPVDLQSRFLYPSGTRRNAVVTLRSGKQIQGELLLLTVYDVALRDEAGWYRCWPVAEVNVDVKDPLAKHRELLPRYTDADMHNMLAYLETLR